MDNHYQIYVDALSNIGNKINVFLDDIAKQQKSTFSSVESIAQNNIAISILITQQIKIIELLKP